MAGPPTPAATAALETKKVNALLLFVLWCLLFVISWPVAPLALVVLPLVWLLSLPLRLLGVLTGVVFDLLRAVLGLPARLLGGRPDA